MVTKRLEENNKKPKFSWRLVALLSSLLLLLATFVVTVNYVLMKAVPHTVQEQTITPKYSTSNHKTTNNTPINYRLQTQTFLDILKSCIQNQECNIYFQHIGKTGGTTIENRFYPKLWEPSWYADGIMNKFLNNTNRYCNKKFMSLQVDGKKSRQVIEMCRNKKSRMGKPTVVLTAIREPISRLLSFIHQQCNENSKLRPKEIQKACRNCNYEDDVEIWDDIANRSNNVYYQYQNLKLFATLENTKVLYIDTHDIDDLFNKLLEWMPEWEGDVILGKNEKQLFNPEKLQLCSFGLKSPMIKALKPSLEIYSNLTLGIF